MTAPGPDVLSDVDLDAPVPCGTRLHELHVQDEPAAYLVRRVYDHCRCKGRRPYLVFLCRSGWELHTREGLQCQGCGYAGPIETIWKLVQEL